MTFITTSVQKIFNLQTWHQQQWPLLIFVFIVMADQYTKWLISGHLEQGESVAVTSFFNLALFHNTGAAFSFLSHWDAAQIFFTVLGVLVSLVIVYLIVDAATPLRAFLLWLILAGAVGNLIDRFRLGYVVDFLDFYIGTLHWPAFNIADSCITIGALFYMWCEIKSLSRETTTSPKNVAKNRSAFKTRS